MEDEEKWKEKDCTNCKYEDIDPFKDPCLDCFSKGHPLYLVNWSEK